VTKMISELFERPPCREIRPVIQATELAPEVLGQELDEYVVTPEIQEHLRDFLTQFIESRPGRRPDGVCAWISGWFGSGKSHLLKFLGAVLENRELVLSDGARVGATHYLLTKWSLPFETHLRELKTRVVFVNLLGYISNDAPGLSEIIHKALIKDDGLADIPWVAEMERQLKTMGLYERFEAEVQASGQRWSEVRGQPVVALPLMAEALTRVDPKTWSSIELAQDAIDKQSQLRIDPIWLGDRLEQQAKEIDPVSGRLVIALDEVGLYLGNFHDRYLELKAIAESITRDKFYGKVWLVVTSQEAPELKIQEVSGRQEELAWLQDRFPLKFKLTPENIDTVVRVRLLKKTPAGAAAVVAEVQKAPGALATGATLRGATRQRELFEAPSAEALAETYPLLPYQVRLSTEILGNLRGHGYQPEGLTGRERAILGIAQATICDSGLTERPVGALVTMDQIFDGIVGDIKAVPTEHEHEIRELKALGKLGEPPHDVSVQAVAKAVYLLHRVPQWIPATAENIAAALYPALGTPGEQVLDGVRKCLAVLIESHHVGEQEGAYRWLSQIERTFEEDVARERVTVADRRRLARDLLSELLDDFRTLRFRNGIRALEVEVIADGETLRAGRHLKLAVTSPFADAAADVDRIERIDSVGSRDTVWLLTEPAEDLVRLVDRALAMEKVLGRQPAGSGENAEARRQRERELETLRHQTLPHEVRERLRRGTIVAAGLRNNLRLETWDQSLREALEARAEEVFYEFASGAASVKDDDIGRILSWQGGALPDCYRTLQVVDGDRIRQDGPLLAKVTEEVSRRDRDKESLRGADLSDHFDLAPFGWDERVTRLALAALLRNAAVEVRTAQGTFASYRDEPARRALTNRPTFKDARFHPAQLLSEADRRKASGLVATWFGVVKEAPEEIDEALRSGLDEVRVDAGHLATRLADLRLGGADVMRVLAADAANVLGRPGVVGRLTAVLEPALQGRMGEAISLCRKLKDFEKAGQLARADMVAKSLNVLGSVDPNAAAKLRTGLASVDLPAEWAALWSTYQSALHGYEHRFAAQHLELSQRASHDLDELRALDRAERISSQIEAIASMVCVETDPKPAPPELRCESCGRVLTEIERDLLRVDQLRSAALQVLAAEDVAAGAERLEPLSLSGSITAPEQLDEMIAGLRAYTDKILKSGPLQVEVKATPDKRSR